MSEKRYGDENLIELARIVIETGDTEAALALKEKISTASAQEKQELSDSLSQTAETDEGEATALGSEKLFADHDQEIFGGVIAHIEDFSDIVGTLRNKEAELRADETESTKYNESTASLGVSPQIRGRMTQIGEGLKTEINDFESELKRLSQVIFEKYNLLASRDLRQNVIDKISALGGSDSADVESETPRSDAVVSSLIENIYNQDLREGVYRRIENKANEGLKELIRPRFEERARKKAGTEESQIAPVTEEVTSDQDIVEAGEAASSDDRAQKIKDRLAQNRADEEARGGKESEQPQPVAEATAPEITSESPAEPVKDIIEEDIQPDSAQAVAPEATPEPIESETEAEGKTGESETVQAAAPEIAVAPEPDPAVVAPGPVVTEVKAAQAKEETKEPKTTPDIKALYAHFFGGKKDVDNVAAGQLDQAVAASRVAKAKQTEEPALEK